MAKSSVRDFNVRTPDYNANHSFDSGSSLPLQSRRKPNEILLWESSEEDTLLSDSNGESASGSTWLQELVSSEAWQGVVMSVIGVNTIAMAIEVDHHHAFESFWIVVNNLFVTVFFCELLARIVAFKLGFFTNEQDRWWNCFDFAVVTAGVADQWIAPILFPSRQSNKAVVILRLFRILRVFRSVRLIRHVPALRILIHGFLDALVAASWIFMFFVFLIFFCGIFVTTVVKNNIEMWEDQDRQDVDVMYGSLRMSMFNLFRFVTLDDWSATTELIAKKLPAMRYFFMVYVFFASFTVLSLLTGVIADEVVERGNHDEAADRKEAYEVTMGGLKKYFEDDEDGCLGLDEIETEKQVSTHVAMEVASGHTTLKLRSYHTAFKKGVAVKISHPSEDREEIRVIESIDAKTRVVQVQGPFDYDYPLHSKVEAIHEVVQAVMSQGYEEKDAIEMLVSFDGNWDRKLNYEEMKRGMELGCHDTARGIDTCLLLFQMNAIQKRLPFNEKEDQRFQRIRNKEAAMVQRLARIEELIMDVIHSSLSTGR